MATPQQAATQCLDLLEEIEHALTLTEEQKRELYGTAGLGLVLKSMRMNLKYLQSK